MQIQNGENEGIQLKKKPLFIIQPQLHKYLKTHGREVNLPLSYELLAEFDGSFPLYDKNGKDSLWESVHYSPDKMLVLNKGLTYIYSLLKTDGDTSVMEHLKTERIDYCSFGNSNPFRIRIINLLNDNYDYFYVKRADSSRVYGLELEHILSPNRINYIVNNDTLIEEHIAGMPGDVFIADYMNRDHFKESYYNKVRIAKEFVKFNERCFVRLLGDMRSYNYVVDITPDFEEEQYRIRAIDFDQQSYEGKKTLYLPQFYKENNPIVHLCMELLTNKTITQYQHEERSLILRRLRSARYKIKDLIDCMRHENISTADKIWQLKQELNDHYKTNYFDDSQNMGDLVRANLYFSLIKNRG